MQIILILISALTPVAVLLFYIFRKDKVQNLSCYGYFGIDRSPKAKAVILVAPILAHGLFDSILFCMNMEEGLALICLFLFLYFSTSSGREAKKES